MKNNLLKVFTGSEIEAILLQGELEENGISSTTQYASTSLVNPFCGGAPVALDLFIIESDLEKAKPIVEEYLQNRDTSL
jgi:hypothetical protein